MSLRGQYRRHCARATQLLSKKCCIGGEPLATNGPRLEPKTSRSRDERVTARPIGRLNKIINHFSINKIVVVVVVVVLVVVVVAVVVVVVVRNLFGLNHRQHRSKKHSCNKTLHKAREHRTTLSFSSQDATQLKS